jgi:hypothetical protein
LNIYSQYKISYNGTNGHFKVSWLGCENAGFAVSGVMDAFLFAAQVVAPVGVEVAAGGEGALGFPARDT